MINLIKYIILSQNKNRFSHPFFFDLHLGISLNYLTANIGTKDFFYIIFI